MKKTYNPYTRQNVENRDIERTETEKEERTKKQQCPHFKGDNCSHWEREFKKCVNCDPWRFEQGLNTDCSYLFSNRNR